MEDLTAEAMNATSERLHAYMFGIDRTIACQVTVGSLRLYARDLRSLTVEELESAILGEMTWINLPDYVPTGPVGLAAWVPVNLPKNGLSSDIALMKAYPPSSLPETPASRLEQVMAWLHNTDEDGNPDPLITPELAAKLLEGP